MPDFLFDIGKVLLDFDFESSLRKFLPSNHPDPAAALEKLLSRKDEFEAGQVSTDDYTDWAIKTLDTSATIEEFHHAWRNIFTPNPLMWETVRKLHAAGHRLILFSNINGIHCPWIFENFPEFSLFHGAVLSYEVGAIKPQLEIYQHAIDKYSLVPENTLYIDDLPANIATGQQLGFHTHTYDINNHREFELWLAQKLSFLKTEH
jgi:HAD superfamily hydrolase (TIGR01509 family)